MEVILKSTIVNKFINQQPLSPGAAVTNQRHQVAVVDPTDNINLRLKLPLALPAVHFQAFHGHFLPVGQHPLVHVTEPALPQQVRLGEPARRRRQVFVREAALVEPQRHRRVWRRQRRSSRTGESCRAHLAAAHHRRRCHPPVIFRVHAGASRRKRYLHHVVRGGGLVVLPAWAAVVVVIIICRNVISW